MLIDIFGRADAVGVILLFSKRTHIFLFLPILLYQNKEDLSSTFSIILSVPHRNQKTAESFTFQLLTQPYSYFFGKMSDMIFLVLRSNNTAKVF